MKLHYLKRNNSLLVEQNRNLRFYNYVSMRQKVKCLRLSCESVEKYFCAAVMNQAIVLQYMNSVFRFAMFLFLSTFTLGLMLVAAHETGAPPEACKDFATKHHLDHDETKPRYEPQTGPAPYKITANPTSGGQAEITIAGVGEKFRGFMIQGNDGSGKIVGTFEEGKESQNRVCSGGDPGNTATHINPEEKPVIELVWKAPEGFTGKVVFRATIVKDYETFWYDVKSNELNVA